MLDLGVIGHKSKIQKRGNLAFSLENTYNIKRAYFRNNTRNEKN